MSKNGKHRERHDRNRKYFSQVMRDNGIIHGTVAYEHLRHFLDDSDNSPYLQLYYNLCTGYFDIKEIDAMTMDLINELNFIYTECNYSYRKLFNLDPEWYDYFKENAWPTGQRKCQDRRRGVDREQIDDIMRIRTGPPRIELEKAIVLQCQKRYGSY